MAALYIIIGVQAVMNVVLAYCLYRMDKLLTDAAKRSILRTNEYCLLSDYCNYLKTYSHEVDPVSFEEYKKIRKEYDL